MKTIAVIPARYASTRMPGNPLAAAEVPLIIQGVRDGIDTTEDTAWRIIRVRHRFSRDFTTSIDAEMGDGAVKEKKKPAKKKAQKKQQIPTQPPPPKPKQ